MISEMNIGGLNQCSAGIHQAMLLGYAHSKQQVDCVDIEEVSPAAMGPRAAVRIVWSPFQPVYSVVYEGVTAMIMSYFCEKNLFAMNPLLMYNWSVHRARRLMGSNIVQSIIMLQ